MRNLVQGQPAKVMVFMALEKDGITGAEGLAPQVMLSRDGGPFISMDETPRDRGFGWYCVSLSETDTSTVGPLVSHLEAQGANPCDVLCQVGAPAVRQELAQNFQQLNEHIESRASQADVWAASD